MAMPVNPFGLSRLELKILMSKRKEEAVLAVEKLEGVESIAAQLETNLKEGLSGAPQDLESRRSFYGANVLPHNPPKSFISLCFDAIQDPTLIILIVAAVISIALGVGVEERKETAWIEGFAILVAVVLVVFITALNDWTKDRQFRGLQKKLDSDSRFSVLRDGNLHELPLAELVVGDVAQFKYGNTFPVDGLLIQGFDIRVDESSLTGESDLVKKDAKKDPMLLAGTQVMEGGGTMLVTAVGPHSQQGIIFTLLNQKSEEEGGFITQWLRRVRERLCPKKEEEEDPAVELAKQRQMELQEKEEEVDVKEYDPEEPISVEPPLTGLARFNPVKQVRRRKRMKKQHKKTKSSGVESGSVLQKKLNKLAQYIAYSGTAAAVLCVVVLILVFVITKFGIDREPWNSATDFSELLHFIIIGITVLVVAVPEGLPLAVTIALAFSVKKMLKDNNLVRYLHACETMGNSTAICSDKTGTLTTNRMTVVESYFAGSRYEVIPPQSDLPDDLIEILKLNIAVNSSYTSKLVAGSEGEVREAEGGCWEWFKSVMPFGSGDPTLGQGLAKQVGNVTECALLGFLVELGFDYDTLRAEYPTERFVKVFTFNSARKSMSTVIPLPGGGYRLFTKGASEIVLAKCTHVIGENGRIASLTEVDKKEILSSVVQSMASRALRTIGLAYRDFPASSKSEEISHNMDWDNEEEVVSNLTLVGIVGIQDPVRPEVPGCIKSCQNAGITVRMVTGDNIETARAIAEKCGIIRKGDGFLVLDGSEFNKRVTDTSGSVDQEKMDRIWPRLRVLARSSPTDKYTLVDGIIRSRIHKNREVVAVTGDGTNDGPALKRADVGFAMGIAGTDVAKGACDIILTDDNFASIVKAVKWGRNVYDSISKFLQFQLTVNIVAVLLTLVAAFTVGDSPLTALQLLWVNLIMDTFASLALATESPTDELLKRKPYGRKKALISRQMWVFLGGHSIYQLAVLLVILFAGPTLFDIDNGTGRELRAAPSPHFTVIFHTFVMFQIFNEVNARKIHGERNVFNGIWRNWIFIAVMVGQVSVQTIIVQVPYVNTIFSSSGLTLDLWLWCIFLGSTELVVGQLLTLIPVSKLPERFRPTTDEEAEEEEIDADVLDDGTRARILWVKSLSRLRAQIRVVNAFRSGLEQGSMGNIAQMHGTPRSYRYTMKPVTGIETAV